MQLTFKWRAKRNPIRTSTGPRTVAELRAGEAGVLEHLDLPGDVAKRLMELGFVPGHTVTPAHTAPGGGARVFRVDGSEIALRSDTAARLRIRFDASALD